jgi:hypothetical protein
LGRAAFRRRNSEKYFEKGLAAGIADKSGIILDDDDLISDTCYD